VVLAAGSSERFGPENKLLADIGGVPLLRSVVRAAIGAGIAEIVVVTGCDAARIAAAVAGLPAPLVHNPRWRSGMGSSVATGIAAIGADIDGAFVVPGDLPGLTSTLLAHLASAFDREEGGAVVFPLASGGGQRNPVLWPRRHFHALANLRGDAG